MSTELIIYQTGTKLNNFQRRTLARAEMAHYSGKEKLRYLLFSPLVRHFRMSDGKLRHSLLDELNIISESENEPRIVLQQLKSRLKKRDNKLYQKMIQVKLPSWEDHKRYKVEVISGGWLLALIMGHLYHTPIGEQIRDAFAEDFDEYERDNSIARIDIWDTEILGIGSEISLRMQSIYEIGDYDNPVMPPGCPE
jgi:hypothetical protein